MMKGEISCLCVVSWHLEIGIPAASYPSANGTRLEGNVCMLSFAGISKRGMHSNGQLLACLLTDLDIMIHLWEEQE
jgi:hypothetical protein